MAKDDRGKRFSCLKCGEPFVGYPPDDFHQTASITQSEVNDPIEVEYRCEKCGNTNVLYWGRRKITFAVG
jgi:DNA-directed RNA polymerase subunit M/transcription elongation factor TFIIS